MTRKPEARPEPAGSQQLDGKPPYSKGDRHHRGAALLLPADFDYAALNEDVRLAFGGYERLPHSSVIKAVPTALGATPEPPVSGSRKKGPAKPRK